MDPPPYFAFRMLF